MNEVTKTQSTQVATQQPQHTNILPSDVIIPRLLLMQGSSDFVKDRKAQIGDMVRNTDAVKLGDPDSPVEFVALCEPIATWVKEMKPIGANRFEYRGMIPRNAKNDDLPWSYYADKDGNETIKDAPGAMEWRRVKCLSTYILLPKDIEAEFAERLKAEAGDMPDLSKALTPLMVSFRSTSYGAGKEISTYFTKAASFGVKSWQYSLKLGCFLDKNDQGTFYVFKLVPEKPKPVAKDFHEKILYWSNLVNSATNLQVDDTGVSEVEKGEIQF